MIYKLILAKDYSNWELLIKNSELINIKIRHTSTLLSESLGLVGNYNLLRSRGIA
jgi:hypothetical protein